MIYRKLGDSDLMCSVVGLGTWGMGGDSWAGSGEVDDDLSIATLRAGIDAGINLIDTAQPYGMGHSEELIGEAIQGLRDKVIIADKCVSFRKDDQTPAVRDWSPDVLRFQLEGSLKRLGVDQIDLYQVHWPDPNHSLKDAFCELNKMLEEGFVRYIGVSNFTPELIEEAKQYCPIVSIQPPYCLLNRAVEETVLPYCEKTGLGVLTYGSLGGGVLTGKYTERPIFDPAAGRDIRTGFYPYYSEEKWPKTDALLCAMREVAAKRSCPVAHVAIAWVLSKPYITSALVGARNIAQLEMNVAAADVVLTEEEIAIITAASDAAIA